MLPNTRTKVLIPERILKEKPNWSEHNFLFMVRNYLIRYPKYQLIRVEGSFAVCERPDEVKERRKRK